MTCAGRRHDPLVTLRVVAALVGGLVLGVLQFAVERQRRPAARTAIGPDHHHRLVYADDLVAVGAPKTILDHLIIYPSLSPEGGITSGISGTVASATMQPKPLTVHLFSVARPAL